MSRDLFTEVETLIGSANTYIRRKAALCAMRICRKVPDLHEHFLDKAKILLADKNHGVLLCGLTLVTSLCEEDEAEGGENGIVETFKPLTPHLVQLLKNLAAAGYTPEHDVTGITDPFLQVKILHLLRTLGRGDAHISEQINDILAQVATNTDSTKNVGNSILYEAVLTILDIEADSGLRVLGVNILGKFLANKDNNIRYVALNTLLKVVNIEPNAVQRHRATILECLRDPDISIRRRALELSFTLINEGNVRVLIRELLSFLEVADNEFKQNMTTQIGIAADRYAPNKRWHVDTMLRVLKLAGNHVKEQILSSFIRLIATTPDLQQYSVQKLFAALKSDISQETLTLAAAWTIGEYGDGLLRGGHYEGEEAIAQVAESEIVDLLSTILSSMYATQIVTEYVITAAMKLTTRLSEPAQIERIRRLLDERSTSLDIEIQQRAVEFSHLFSYNEIRKGVLEKMPPPEIREDQRVFGEAAPKKKAPVPGRSKKSVKPQEQDLLNLIGDTPIMESFPTDKPNGSRQNIDLLADLLGGDLPLSSTTSTTSNSNGLLDLTDPTPSSQGPPPSQPSPSELPVYDKNNLRITLQLQRNPEGTVQALARFRNTSSTGSGSPQPLSAIGLQAAVPKSQKLQLQGISRTVLRAGEEATQAMVVTGSRPPLRLRLKVAYEGEGCGSVAEQVDWSEAKV